MTVTAKTTVDELVQGLPGATAVLNRLGIDTCCGGYMTLEESCLSRDLDLEVVLAALRELEGGRVRGE